MKLLLPILFLLFSDGFKNHSEAQLKPPSTYFVEDFQTDPIGDLPRAWYNQRGEAQPFTYEGELRDTYNYSIVEEGGNKFLRFEGTRGKHLNYPFLDESDVNIFETPILSWDWRIHEIPIGGNEDSKKNNDTAASIYVVFDLGHVLFRKVPKSIRYTWSSTLPVGTELSKFHGNQKIVVVGSGDKEIGDWQNFERNIVEDYKRLFGDDPPAKPLAILLLSDGNDTQNIAKADYDNILLKSPHSN